MRLREVKELKGKNAEELKATLGNIEGELFQAKLKHGVGQLENTTRMREMRRDIARIRTELRAREQQPQATPEAAQG
jgi:large subunit ribosomal protein L29